MEIEVFEEPHGFSVKVGRIYQPYDPEPEGFQPMTEERAREVGAVI